MTPQQANQSAVALSSLWPFSLPVVGLLVCLLIGGSWLQDERSQQRAAQALAQLQQLREDSTQISQAQYVIRAQSLAPTLSHLTGNTGRRFQSSVANASRTLASATTDQVANAQALGSLRAETDSVVSALRHRLATHKHSAGQMLGLLVATLLAVCAGAALLARKQRVQSPDRPWPASNVDTQLFEHAPVPIVYSDQRDIIQAANGAYLRMSGYQEEETLGQPLFFDLSGRQGDAFFTAMQSELAANGRWHGEVWLRNKSGEAYPNKVVRLAVSDGGSEVAGYLTVSAESIQADEQQKLMLWQAHHDPLTKLPNRILLEERLNRTLLQEKPSGTLISMDLDRFKEVNDSVGPTIGDRVLMDVAMRLAMCAEEDDTVARMGGDAFTIVSHSEIPEQRAEALTSAIMEAFRAPIVLDDKEIFIQASIGVVCFPKDGDRVAELLQKADAARGEVKRKGGNGAGYFEPEINERAERRLTLQTALRSAIAEGQLTLALQPIIALSGQQLLGAEALLRWNHPILGQISPAEFIPVAENSGLIMDIGLWVVDESRRILQSWADHGHGNLRLSLNVSPLQIQRIEDCQRLIDRLQGADTHLLTLEITESAIIDHSETAKFFLERVRRLGCQIALDDFGTGFSSLAYLREFNFDVLKVDKVFIDSLDSPRDLGLVASIVSMGKILGMRVVAEGVEEPAQVEQLSRIGCHFAQGYLFARPLACDEFLDYVAAEQTYKTA
ncbi:MAG: putative bifunctional diguanylate cyclase/phosphodiesterase [Pseudomonadales bacterium]